MKKITLAVLLLLLLCIGSGIYVNFLKHSVDIMNNNVIEAYRRVDSLYDEIPTNLNNINSVLETDGTVLCAFIDQKLINDVKNEFAAAKELYLQQDKQGLKLSLVRLKDKINTLKDTEEFDFKKILWYRCTFLAVY